MTICKNTHILNPVSGRCVKKTGAIGKKLVTGSKTTKPRQHSKFVKRYGKGLVSALPADFIILKQIGKGNYGRVYLLCKDDNGQCRKDYVLKLQRKSPKQSTTKFKQDIDHEIQMHKKFFKAGIAPELITNYYFTHRNQLYSVIVMSKVNVLNDDLNTFPKSMDVDRYCTLVVNKIDKLVKTMCKHRLIHRDMHNENIATLIHDTEFVWQSQTPFKLLLIDFGMARSGRCNPRIEILQLVRSLMIDKDEFKNQKLFECLTQKLYQLYTRYARKNSVPFTFKDIDTEFRRLHSR